MKLCWIAPNYKNADVNYEIDLGKRYYITLPLFLKNAKEKEKNPINNADNMPFNYTSTALITASENGCQEAFELLVKNGADINKKRERSDGMNSLHKAAQYGHLDIIKYIFNQINLKPNETDKNGVIPFIIAAEYNQIDVLNFFLTQNKCEIEYDKSDIDGFTALKAARENNNNEVVKLLMASDKIKDKKMNDYGD
jgi:ankyrin repeat protein